MTMRDEPKIGFADMVAFACELAMFALIIAAVNYLVDGGRSWLLGIAAAIVVALIWARGWHRARRTDSRTRDATSPRRCSSSAWVRSRSCPACSGWA